MRHRSNWTRPHGSLVTVPDMRSGVWFPLFEELANPRVVMHLGAEAEECGWDGVFVWDHVRWREPIKQVADPWITLAAIASATEEIMLGPMVTPLARRRPAKVARETATLDRFSDGRLILAVAWSGEPVNHHGKHYLVDDVRFLPRPAQEGGIPVWAAAFPGHTKPVRRAARCEGFFPVGLESVDQFAQAVAKVRELRGDSRAPYDIAVELPPGSDVEPYAEAGATWLMTGLDPGVSVADVRAVIREG